MSIIVVPKSAGMSAATALHTTIASALDAHDAVTLDLRDVIETDLSFLQIVEAGRREAARRDKTLALAAPATGVVRATLERAGFLAAPDATDSPDAIAFWLHGDLPA